MKKQTLHYPFCQDLGNKEIYYLDSTFQPQYDLYVFNHPNWIEKITDTMDSWLSGTTTYASFPGNSDIKFPSNIYKIEKYQSWTTGFWEKGITLFLAPKDFYKGITIMGVGSQKSDCFYEKEESYRFVFRKTTTNNEIIKEINKSFNEFNHLLDHSTFHSYFCHDFLNPANLRYLDFVEENGEWVIKYTLKTKATIAGIYYFFYSGSIDWQLRLEVRQTIPSAGNLKALLTGATVIATVSGGFAVAGATGTGSSEGLMTAQNVNKTSSGIQKSNQTTNLKDAESILPNVEEEVSQSFGLFDFWSKLKEKQLWGKIYVSNNLKNNLLHNNNENPITYPLNITFQKLGNILRKGYWQGKLTLDYDPGGNMAKCFARGVYFYEDKEKDFPNPNLNLKKTLDLISYDLVRSDIYTAQTITEPKITDIPFDYRPEAKGYGHATYLTIDNDSVRNNDWKGLNWDHWDNNKGWCWGCTQQKFSGGYSGSAHDPNSPACPSFPDKMVGKFTPSQDCNFEGKFHVDGSNTHYEPLKGGTEYEIWVNHTKLWFRYLETKTTFQKVPGHDDFSGMDWTPPPGSGGDTEIPFTDPDVGVDPTQDPEGPMPEPDFIPDMDPGGPGEPEITPLEPDITPDADPFDPDFPEPDIPDIPQPEPEPPTSEPEPDKPKDTGDKDPNDDEPEKPEDFDK